MTTPRRKVTHYTTDETANLLNLSRRYVNALVNEGKLPAVKIRGRTLIPVIAAHVYLEKMTCS